LSLVNYVTAAAQVQQHNCKEYGGGEWLKEWAADFHFTHSSLLALVVVIFQAGKAYSNSDISKVKHNNNKPSIVVKEYVHAWVPTFGVIEKSM
jgi:hypothetical protein